MLSYVEADERYAQPGSILEGFIRRLLSETRHAGERPSHKYALARECYVVLHCCRGYLQGLRVWDSQVLASQETSFSCPFTVASISSSILNG